MANEFKIKKGLIVTGASGGTVVDIQGSQGQLFSVTDDLSGSIFAVSDISGVPILDVNSSGLSTFSDNVVIGSVDSVVTGLNIGEASPTIQLFDTTNDGKLLMYMQDSSAVIGAYSNHSLKLFSDSTLALTIDTSQNATFAGDVTVSGGDITVSNAITGISGGSFRVKNNGGTTIATFADDLSATFAAQAFSTATSSGDGSSTLTTKGYVDGLITGATIYRGAWDPSGGGYGSPDLSGVTQTSGYYYICSAAGTAEPNGTGTEPDTWAVGDWVIYNDVSGAGQWQKIDNSSVLSGVGTGQTLALWEGAGSVTDSETLGNSIITQQSDDEISILSTNATTGQNGKLTIYSYDDGDTDVKNLQLTVNNGGDANITNTGPYLNLTALNYIKSNNVHIFNQDTFMYYGKYIRFLDATSPQNSWNRTLGVSASDVVQVGGIAGYNTGKGQLALFSNNAQAMFIDEDQRVQFNAYDSTNNTGTPTYLLGTDASGNVVKTNTVPGSGAGPYLPLSAGSSYPLTGGLYIPSYIYHVGDTNTLFGFGGQDLFIINTGGGRRLTVTNTEATFENNLIVDGNVGIGTTSPVNYSGYTSLQIDGSNGAVFRMDRDDNTVMFEQAVVSNSVYYKTITGTDIWFGTSNTERMRIDDSGNVGIGTSSPGAKLHVDGTAIFDTQTGAQPFYITRDGAANQALKIHVDDAAAIFESIQDETADNYGAFQFIMDAGVTEPYFDVRKGTALANTLFRVDGNGKVGIGTTSPGSKLSIRATTATHQLVSINRANSDTAALYLGNDTSNEAIIATNNGQLRIGKDVSGTFSEYVRINDTGNVGIGTTSPQKKLDVYLGTASAVASIGGGIGVGEYAGLHFGYSETGNSLYRHSAIVFERDDAAFGDARGKIHLLNSPSGSASADLGDARLTILPAGNVGIGTTSPGTKLQVGTGSGATVDTAYQIVADGSAISGIQILSGATQSGRLVFGDSDNNDIGIIKYDHSDNSLQTIVNASERMRVTAGGNVGIGNTSPQAKLDIYDTFSKTAANPNTVEVFHNGSVSTNNIYPVAGLFTQRVSGSANVYATGLVGVAEKLGDYGYIAKGVQGIGKLSGNISINNADMEYMGVEGRIEMEGSNSVNLDDRGYSFYGTAEIDSGSHLKEYHGLYLNTPTNNGTILNKYGISQVDGSSKNYFAGNVGIGTSTPNAKLDIQGTQGQLFSVTDNLSGSIFAVADISGVPIFDVNSSGVSYFDGNVGIGTTSPNSARKLDVHGGIETTTSLWIGGNSSTEGEHKIKIGQNRSGNGYAYIDLIGDQAAGSYYSLRIIRHNSGVDALSQIVHTGTGNFEIKATSAADIILNSPGNVGISQTSPLYKLDVTGNGRFTSTVTATNFILSSDERLKENIEKACDNRIKADWKTFELKTDKGQKRYGVIAQELEKTNPEFVREDTQGFKSVAYIDLLIAKIAELEARLEKLEK